MRSSLPSGKSAAPPARCIHRLQRDTSSAGYRLLVSRASAGASRELSSRRSPALVPHTCAVSPTFRYGAFVFVASALAAVPSARLWGSRASPMKEKVRGASAAVTCPGAWRRIGYRTRRTPCSAFRRRKYRRKSPTALRKATAPRAGDSRACRAPPCAYTCCRT